MLNSVTYYYKTFNFVQPCLTHSIGFQQNNLLLKDFVLIKLILLAIHVDFLFEQVFDPHYIFLTVWFIIIKHDNPKTNTNHLTQTLVPVFCIIHVQFSFQQSCLIHSVCWFHVTYENFKEEFIIAWYPFA